MFLFVKGETRLTWVGLFLEEFPNADVYLVGGTLRDVILGRLPNDIDVMIRNVEPGRLDNWLNVHGAAEFVGRFGTFKFVPNGNVDKLAIDIALPRTERKLEDSNSGRRDMDVKFDYRLPVQDDLARRDFTINAMAYNIRTGRLLDPFLGMQDLYAGIVNAVLIPTTRFEEDATRMLRGLRFASQFNFGIEKMTWQAIKDNIKLLNNTKLNEDGKKVYVIPREAIGREFLLGFMEHPTHTLNLWSESKALEMFMPQLAELEYENEAELQKTINLLSVLKRSSFISGHGYLRTPLNVLVAALFSFLPQDAKKHARKICTNLHFHQFPNTHKAYVDCNTVMWLVEHQEMFTETDPANMRPSEFEKMFLLEKGRELILLIHAVEVAKGTHSVARERLHIARRIKQGMIDMIDDEGIEGRLPKLVTGRNIQELGIEPGPTYRDILDEIRDAQLTSRIENKADAIDLLRQIIAKM